MLGLAQGVMQTGDHARLYLVRIRQLVTGTCAVAYGVLLALPPHTHVALRMALLFLVATALGGLYALIARRATVRHAMALSIPLDAVMIAVLIWGTGVPQMLSIALLWPVALASYFLPVRYSAVVAAGSTALWIGAVAAHDVHLAATAIVANVLAQGALDTLLVYLGAQLRAGTALARRERDCDAAVLRLSATMAQEADAQATLARFVQEVAAALGADRCLLRVFEDSDHPEHVVEWHAPDLEAYAGRPLAERAQSDARAGVVMRSDDTSTYPEQEARLLREQRVGSGIGMPIVLDGHTIALLSLQQRAARAWSRSDEDLLARISPTVAAVLHRQRMITSQRTALETTRELADLRERLVAMTSHELRTPLTAVVGYLETFAARDARISDAALGQLLTGAMEGAYKLERIIEDLLVLSRMHSALPPLHFDGTSIGRLIERLEPYSHGSTMDVNYDGCDPLTELVADGDRLVQSLGNLVENAHRHGNASIWLEVSERSGWIVFAVGDGGSGVPREHVGEIFLPFIRFSAHSDSTGMGLSVAQAIAEAHGGSLRYRAALGQIPHAFILSLPIRAAAHRAGG